MYDGPGLTDLNDDENDDDLEMEEEEIIRHFIVFWKDILPEFQQFGTIESLRVCRNHSDHLKGNCYVMYSTEREAKKAFDSLNGRFYGGKKLMIQYCPVVSWKTAVCGLFSKGQCDRGKACNFLHVFRNPGGAFESKDDSPERERSNRDDRGRDNKRDNKSWRENPRKVAFEKGNEDSRVNLSDRSYEKTKDDRRHESSSHDRHDTKSTVDNEKSEYQNYKKKKRLRSYRRS